jgi:hypothetical protein
MRGAERTFMGIAGAFPMPRSQPVPRPDRKGGEVRHFRCARPSSSGSPRISGAFGASLFSLVVALVRLVPRMVGSGPRSCHPPLPSEVYEANARHTSGLAPARSAPGPNQPSRNCLEQRQPLGRGSDYRAHSWVSRRSSAPPASVARWRRFRRRRTSSGRSPGRRRSTSTRPGRPPGVPFGSGRAPLWFGVRLAAMRAGHAADASRASEGFTGV